MKSVVRARVAVMEAETASGIDIRRSKGSTKMCDKVVGHISLFFPGVGRNGDKSGV